MKKHLRLLLILTLYVSVAFPQDAAKIRVWTDSCESLRLNRTGVQNNFILLAQEASQALQMIKEDDPENRSKFCTYAALGYYYQLKFDSAQYFFYESLKSAQKAHDVQLTLKACISLIPVDFQLQQTDKMEECKNILQTIVDTTHNPDNLKNGFYALGNYYQYKSYYSTSEDYFIKSIQIREKEVDTTSDLQAKFDFAIQCDALSKLYLNTEMADKSLEILRKGQRFASVSPNVDNRLASSFVEAFTTSGHIDSALSYDRQLEANVSDPMQFPSEIVSSDLNIAIYYIDHHQYDQALPWLKKGDTLAARTQAPLLIFQAQMIAGRYFEETGKYAEAIPLLAQAIPVARQMDKELYGNTLKYMAIAQKEKGDAVAALRYYEQYVQTTDSLNKEKISRTFADLETHYQTNEKEQRIASLNKENRLNVLELENASRTRLLLVLGLAALGVISLLLYFIYRNKEKLNGVLAERNDQLDDLNRNLALANDTKARLFGIISHDLRAPIGKIVRLLQLQKERPDLLAEETRQKHEERLKKASESVLETMEDLLLWSKSQMEHFTPEFRPVRISDILQKEVGLAQEHLDQEELRIVSRVPASFILRTDENFLTVIIRNLLLNAVKYSEPGSTISVATRGDSELSISNRSSKANAALLNTRLHEGRIDSGSSGLGLQIIKNLAAAIGARVFFQQEGEMLAAVVSWDV